MKRTHAESHVLPSHTIEPHIFHDLGKRLLIGMHTDGLGQITVAFRIARDFLPEPRHELEGIQVVEGLEDLPATAEFEHHHATARTHNAHHFLKSAVLVGHVAKAEAHDGNIKKIVLKGKSLAVTNRNMRLAAHGLQALDTFLDHLVVDVGRPDFAGLADRFAEANQIGRASCRERV